MWSKCSHPCSRGLLVVFCLWLWILGNVFRRRVNGWEVCLTSCLGERRHFSVWLAPHFESLQLIGLPPAPQSRPAQLAVQRQRSLWNCLAQSWLAGSTPLWVAECWVMLYTPELTWRLQLPSWHGAAGAAEVLRPWGRSARRALRGIRLLPKPSSSTYASVECQDFYFLCASCLEKLGSTNHISQRVVQKHFLLQDEIYDKVHGQIYVGTVLFLSRATVSFPS